MTLVLTEITSVGIAMAADSAITKIKGGKILEIDEQGWKKLIRVPKINAGISYWGMIGAITKRQFDIWLQEKIDNGNYTDLNSFADYLVDELNRACKNIPLQQGYDVGIHIAGYSKWTDNVSRPTFFHIHNGHGRIKLNDKRDSKKNIIYINPVWDSDPRKLFEKHFDFPDPNKPLQENIRILNNGGWITRNGDFFLYSVFQDYINAAIQFIHLSPNIRIPKNPTSISSRKGYLHIILETIIRLYRCSNQSKIVGGSVTSLAIGPKGFIN